MFQISFIASREQTWAEMINTIKAVHLSTVADGAAFQGGKRESVYGKARFRNKSPWNCKEVNFFLHKRSFQFYFEENLKKY